MSGGDIHDRFLKKVLGDPKRAEQFLKAILPPGLTQHLDWSTFRADKTQYGDKRLKSKFSDLLYSTAFLSTKKHKSAPRLFLYFRIEHQSSRERFMPLRCFSYDNHLWESWLKANKKTRYLPMILPIVLCHAKGGWKSPVDFQDILAIPPELKPILAPFIPQRKFLLIDLTDDENPFDLDNPPGSPLDAYLQLVLAMLRDLRFHKNIEKWLYQWKDKFLQFWQAHPSDDEIAVIEHYFLFAQKQVTAEKLEHFMANQVDSQLASRFKSAGHLLIEQGKLEGRLEGKTELLTAHFARRLNRPLSPSEQVNLAARIQKEGPDAASEALFDLSPEQLEQWLAAVPGLSLRVR